MTPTRKSLPVLASAFLGAAALLGVSSAPANATEGYFQYGYGARSKGLAGAGVADSRDATAPATNPAGLAGISTQINAAFTLFSPRREFTGSSALPAPFSYGFTPLGNYDSNANWHAIPNFALAYQLDEDSSLGLMVIGNGGMNTTWPRMTRNLTNGPCPAGTTGIGVYCMGKAGVDLMQMMIGATYARRLNETFSFGITPMFALQRFRADGLAAFGAASTDPGNLTARGYSYSYGGGVRAGVQVDLTDRIRLGLAGQTPMWMTKFDKYSGLFANDGSFDIPANITAGVAFDVTDAFRVMFDYKHIFYGSVDAISNPSTNILTCVPGSSTCLGGKNGPGFGWDDIDVFKVGVEWDATSDLTLRAGYSYNTNPISSRDVMFNILAPGVVQHHITAGLEYDLDENNSIELAAAYVPETTVTGRELPGFGNPAHKIELAMHQFELTVGWKYVFNPPKAMIEDPVYKP